MFTVYYEVTTACSLSCGHCHVPVKLRRENPVVRNFSDITVDLSVLKEKLNVEAIVISGGEPTLHKEILNITKYASEHFEKVSVISNCVKPEMLKQIAAHTTVWASIDYFGEAQDKWRGFKGLWRHYISIADIANVRATLLQNNLNDIKKLVKFTADHKRKTTIVPCKGENPQLTPTPQQLQQLLIYIFRNGYEKQAIIDSPAIRMWLATKNPGLMREAEKRGSLCNACDTVIRVDPQGNVKPCPFLDETICIIQDEEIKQKIARARQKIINTYTGKCFGCELNTLCGGCRASLNQHCFLK